jgi:hypothetical protein
MKNCDEGENKERIVLVYYINVIRDVRSTEHTVLLWCLCIVIGVARFHVAYCVCSLFLGPVCNMWAEI